MFFGPRKSLNARKGRESTENTENTEGHGRTRNKEEVRDQEDG